MQTIVEEVPKESIPGISSSDIVLADGSDAEQHDEGQVSSETMRQAFSFRTDSVVADGARIEEEKRNSDVMDEADTSVDNVQTSPAAEPQTVPVVDPRMFGRGCGINLCGSGSLFRFGFWNQGSETSSRSDVEEHPSVLDGVEQSKTEEHKM